jgi:hypothetical protein
VHFPHSVHFDSSTSGALKGDFCVIAPAGHTLITGQTWFWGHLDASIPIDFMELPN